MVDWNRPPPRRLRLRIRTGTHWPTGTGTNQKGAEESHDRSLLVRSRAVPMKGAPAAGRRRAAVGGAVKKAAATGGATDHSVSRRALPRRRQERARRPSHRDRRLLPHHPKATTLDWGSKRRDPVPARRRHPLSVGRLQRRTTKIQPHQRSNRPHSPSRLPPALIPAGTSAVEGARGNTDRMVVARETSRESVVVAAVVAAEDGAQKERPAANPPG